MSGSRALRFTPIYQARVWGGRRLESDLGRTLPDSRPYGESWELCDRPEAQSVVSSGRLAGASLHDLWTRHRAEIFGARHLDHPSPNFPILLKILDCSSALSLQVHPPPRVAAQLGGEPKTELWFIAKADPGARLHAGLRRGVTRERFEAALASGTAADLVHEITPRAGEFLLVESGRIHALGAGLLIYEIQQNSDTTFRVFDWNRIGLDGRPRDLQVRESLASIDFGDFEPGMRSPAPDGLLVECPHFAVRHRMLAGGETATLAPAADDFLAITVVGGAGSLAGSGVRAGDSLLLPAGLPASPLTAHAPGIEWLEITLPPSP